MLTGMAWTSHSPPQRRVNTFVLLTDRKKSTGWRVLTENEYLCNAKRKGVTRSQRKQKKMKAKIERRKIMKTDIKKKWLRGIETKQNRKLTKRLKVCSTLAIAKAILYSPIVTRQLYHMFKPPLVFFRLHYS